MIQRVTNQIQHRSMTFLLLISSYSQSEISIVGLNRAFAWAVAKRIIDSNTRAVTGKVFKSLFWRSCEYASHRYCWLSSVISYIWPFKVELIQGLFLWQIWDISLRIEWSISSLCPLHPLIIKETDDTFIWIHKNLGIGCIFFFIFFLLYQVGIGVLMHMKNMICNLTVLFCVNFITN